MLIKVIAIALFFTLFCSAVAFMVGSLLSPETAIFTGLIFFVISLLVSAATYKLSAGIILRRYKAKPSEDEKLNNMVEGLALDANMPVPKIYILPFDMPNSFAAGHEKNAAICVTEGLLAMNKGEIEGVVSHGLWHIRNGDTMVQDFVSVMAHMLYCTIVLIPLAVLIVKISLNPVREYTADYYGSSFSKKPKDLASALRKMSEAARQKPLKGSPAFESIWVIDPFKREGINLWFSSDPPTARRAKRLDDMVHEGMPEPPVVTEV